MKLTIMAVLSVVFSIGAFAASDAQERLFDKTSRQMQAGDYEGAEAGFLKILQTEPNNVRALGNLGIVYTHMQRYALAIETYQKALRIAPHERGILLNLGLVSRSPGPLREHVRGRARCRHIFRSAPAMRR